MQSAVAVGLAQALTLCVSVCLCLSVVLLLLSPQPPMPKRPIRMIAQDVKLLCPAELRDTCVLLFHHMQKAFSGITFGGPKGPTRISTKQQQQHRAGEGGGSGNSSPKINRSQSDGMQGSSTSLSRSSLGAAGALRRHGSSDTVPTADLTGAVGPNSSSNAGSSSVATPAEEERMLQAILGQNAEAAAAAAAAERKRAAAWARELQARSGSHGGVSAGGASTAPTDSFVSSLDSSVMAGTGPEGLGHVAAAIRAVRAAGGGSGAAAGRGPDDAGLHESPLSGTLSDISHLSATDSSVALSSAAAGGVAPEPLSAAAAQEGGSSGGVLGLVEQMLLEYEIEFVQVQVSAAVQNGRTPHDSRLQPVSSAKHV